jgi:anaerobic magnesium-protoporphyrin IX monomethyl ester cyclase
VASGMRRVSFGLESGSQRLLDVMDKGSDVEANSTFIREAYEAGLSVRCTMMKGYPTETAEDLELTAEFLERHGDYIDRIRFNEFSLLTATPVHEELIAGSQRFGDVRLIRADDRRARFHYVIPNSGGRAYRKAKYYVIPNNGGRAYRKAKSRVLRAVYAINRRRIRSSAREFDGLM